MDSRIEKIKEILDQDCWDKRPTDDKCFKNRCWCCHKNDALAERIAEIK